MTHMSLRLRHKRIHLHQSDPLSLGHALWAAVIKRFNWLPRKRRRAGTARARRPRHEKVRLDQLSDHELKDIGLTRDHPELRQHRPYWDASHDESAQLHQGLRNLQYDLLRRLPRD